MIDAAFEEASASDPGDRRTILIDGFNVLHAVLEEHERASGWWRRSQRERLLRLAAEWPIAKDTLWVAFDGARPAWAQWAEPVVQLEARPPLAVDGRPIAALVHTVYVESADDWIVRRARRAVAPDRTFVVTRDRQVAGRARSAGCAIWSPWEFLSECPRAMTDARDTAGAGDGEMETATRAPE